MNCIKKAQGFTMIEAILALLVISFCTLLFAQIAMLLSKQETTNYTGEDALAIRQMKLLLAQAEDLNSDGNQLSFFYHGATYSLEQYADKLVKRPGFEPLMQGLDDVSFAWKDTCIVLTYERENHTMDATLACE